MAVTKNIEVPPGLVWSLLVSKAYNPLGWVDGAEKVSCSSTTWDSFSRTFTAKDKMVSESVFIDHLARTITFADNNNEGALIRVSALGNDGDTACSVTYSITMIINNEKVEKDNLADRACSAFIASINAMMRTTVG